MKPRWIKLGSTRSTNSYIQDLLRKGHTGEELVVVSEFQEHGRGQGENRWYSRAGENLLMSFALYPAFLSASEQFGLTEMASLAICDLLTSVDVAPLIKWPNDILTERGKVAGILIENSISADRLMHSVVGMGVNLNQTDFPRFPIPASSVALEGKGDLDPTAAAKQLSDLLGERYRQLQGGEGPKLRDEYTRALYGLQREQRFRSAGEEFTGTILGVNRYGQLMVECRDGVRAFDHGGVEFCDLRSR